MKHVRIMLALIVTVLLSLAAAQDMKQATAYTPFGTVEIGEYGVIEGYDPNVAAENAYGTLWVRTIHPDEQAIDVAILGPNGFRDFAEIAEDHLFDDLLPGTYLIAATDDNLEMVSTRVDVTAGMQVPVTLTLNPIATTSFNYAAYEMDDTYEMGDYEVLTGDNMNAELGALHFTFDHDPEMEAEGDLFEVTGFVVGPNDFRVDIDTADEFVEFNDLEPGVYLVGLSSENGGVTQALIEVRAGERANANLHFGAMMR